MKVEDITAEDYPERVPEGLERYDESLGNNQNWVAITEIVVPTQRDKEQLLKAFEYIHDLSTIDSDFIAVNTIMHMYQCADKIKVKNND